VTNSLLKSIFSRRMLVAFIMGFSSGLPLLLTGFVLQAWMKEENVDLTVIGLMTLVGLPYTLKFVWAPILDRYTIPTLGRRKGWLLVFQIGLMAAIVLLGRSNPAQTPWAVALAAFIVTFFSASQDIVIDAYRREDLKDEELGLGSSLAINGYRLGMLLASGGGLILADHIPFSAVYTLMAACLIPGLITTVFTPEPDTPFGTPASLREAVIDPFVEFLKRREALWVLSFILLYKLGDTMASAMTAPLYLDLGFTKTEIGTIVKFFGIWATIAGGFVGGALLLRLRIQSGLWIFGILQALSTVGFAALAMIGHDLTALAAVIAFENITSGMGTAAYAAFMASITNQKFTATQYALLSSFMGVPRVLASAPTGIMAKMMGWESFFLFCAVIAIPGLMLIRRLSTESHRSPQSR
jgi:PAT family beta-lactamase induction signal transducer AmpG